MLLRLPQTDGMIAVEAQKVARCNLQRSVGWCLTTSSWRVCWCLGIPGPPLLPNRHAARGSRQGNPDLQMR